jgi:hypothetical protein
MIVGRRLAFCSFVAVSIISLASANAAEQASPAAELVRAYPKFINAIEGNELVWNDGTRMQIDDGKGDKFLEAMLKDPDIKDMFALHYPSGADKFGVPPEPDFDPGRVRYAPLFTKMYGDCQKTNVLKNFVDVVWLRSRQGNAAKFSKINGAAAALQQVSDELDRLPDQYLQYLQPLQGTYNCRPIAGTNRPSAHGLGIAIDIAGAQSDYWRWSKPDASGHIAYKNRIPWEIVRVFEQHGFIWGGKWYHYDTMHFEYRPELLPRSQ